MGKNFKKQHTNKYEGKIKYKKKREEPKVEEAKQETVTEDQKPVVQESTPAPKKEHPAPTVVQPSEKYKATVQALRNKGFFVDARYGTKIHFNNIIDFRVDKKDVPTVVAVVQFKNKQQQIKKSKKIFRIIRYNDHEIIGMNSNNFNYYVLPKVDVDMTPIPRKFPNRNNNNFQRSNNR